LLLWWWAAEAGWSLGLEAAWGAKAWGRNPAWRWRGKAVLGWWGPAVCAGYEGRGGEAWGAGGVASSVVIVVVAASAAVVVVVVVVVASTATTAVVVASSSAPTPTVATSAATVLIASDGGCFGFAKDRGGELDALEKNRLVSVVGSKFGHLVVDPVRVS
jgi:hypothetical protein